MKLLLTFIKIQMIKFLKENELRENKLYY